LLPDSVQPLTAAQGISAPGIVHQNAPHGFGGRGKEMTTAVPGLGLVAVHQPYKRFMDQGRCLKRLAGRFLSHFRRRQLTQFVIHQRQELASGMRIAQLHGVEDASDFGHGVEDNLRHGVEQASVRQLPQNGALALEAVILSKRLRRFSLMKRPFVEHLPGNRQQSRKVCP